MHLNPQVQNKLSQSKFSTLSKFIAFQTYSKQKAQRQNIESQRKNIQLHVANLYRQTKRVSKQLSKTQIALIQKLNRKSSREEYQRQKEQLKRLKQQELRELKNNNSLARYMNMLKREQAKKELLQQKKQISGYIKSRQKLDEKIINLKKMEQQKMMAQKISAFERNNKMAIQLAKTKAFFQKKSVSSMVRNDLIELQNLKIQKQKQKIQDLRNKKKQLDQLFSKAKHQKIKYETLIDIGKHNTFSQMYELVAQKQGVPIHYNKLINQKNLIPIPKKKKRSKNHKHNLSERKMINSYYDQIRDF